MGPFPHKYAHITSSLHRTQNSSIKGAISLIRQKSFFLAYVQTHTYKQRLISKTNHKTTLKNSFSQLSAKQIYNKRKNNNVTVALSSM